MGEEKRDKRIRREWENKVEKERDLWKSSLLSSYYLYLFILRCWSSRSIQISFLSCQQWGVCPLQCCDELRLRRNKLWGDVDEEEMKWNVSLWNTNKHYATQAYLVTMATIWLHLVTRHLLLYCLRVIKTIIMLCASVQAWSYYCHLISVTALLILQSQLWSLITCLSLSILYLLIQLDSTWEMLECTQTHFTYKLFQVCLCIAILRIMNW